MVNLFNYENLSGHGSINWDAPGP